MTANTNSEDSSRIEADELVGEALALELADSIEDTGLGFIVNMTASFDAERFVTSFAEHSELDIGVVLDGIPSIDDVSHLDNAVIESGVRIANEVGTAIQWRNGESGGFDWNGKSNPDRIVVVVREEPAKINSLHRFEQLPIGRIRQRIAQIMQSRSPFAENEPAQEVWSSLEGEFGDAFDLKSVADYASKVSGFEGHEAIGALGENLHILLLLPDGKLTDNADKVAKRLNDNKDLVDRITNISSRDEQRLTNSILQAEGATRQERAEVIDTIREYQRGNRERLQNLQFSKVDQLLSTSLRRGGTRPTRYDPSSKSLDLIRDGNRDAVSDVATKLSKEIDRALEENESTIYIEFEEGEEFRISEGIDNDYVDLLEDFIGQEKYGGAIYEADDFEDGVEDFHALETEIFNPNAENSAFRKLRRFAENNPEFNSVVDALDTYESARKEVVEDLRRLFIAPFVTLAGDEELLEKTWRYLEAYEKLEQQVNNKYDRLQDISKSGATDLLSEFLLYDAIGIGTERGTNIILSPLHPLHLWKFAKLARDIVDRSDSITEDEWEFLQESIHDTPHLLRSIDLSGNRILAGDHLLQDRDWGTLPVYVPSEFADVGTNDKIWSYVFRKFGIVNPPSSDRFRLSIINPTRPGRVLDNIVEAHENGLLEGCVIEFAFTNSDEQEGPLYGAKNKEAIISLFGPENESDDFEVRVRREFSSRDGYLESLDGNPQHIVLLNDDSRPVVERFDRDKDVEIHPLHVPKIFSYDEFNDEIEIRSSPEGYLFSRYQDLINSLNTRRNDVHRADVRQLELTDDLVEESVEKSSWFIVSTPDTNTDPFPRSNLISREQRGDRDYGVYSKDRSYFVRRLNRLFNQYPLVFEKEDIQQLAEETVDYHRNGLLRLITTESIKGSASNAKGTLGVILALEWIDEYIENPHLIFSIDDPTTRNWLDMGDVDRRADYLLVELTDQGLQIDVFEIKTVDDPTSEFELENGSVKTISGGAIEQLLASTNTIRTLFSREDDLTIQPRRAALREAIYYQFISQDPEGNRREWVDRINEVFNNDVDVEISPRILSLELDNSGHPNSDTTAIAEDTRQEIQVHRIAQDEIVRIVSGERPETAEIMEEEPELVGEEAEEDTEEKGKEEAEEESEPARVETSETAFGRREDYEQLVEELKSALFDFDIEVKEVDPEQIEVGPNIVRFKVELRSGERQQRIKKRTEDLARELALDNEPIIHRLAGTKYVAIDVPRSDRDVVHLMDYLDELPAKEGLTIGELPFIAGITPTGETHMADLRDAPHMLVGGTTGSGKTVFLSSLLISLYSNQGAEHVDFTIIDPKGRDFTLFNHLPNLEPDEVLTDPDNAVELFDWLIEEEIPRRDEILDESMSVDIIDHNERAEEPLKPLVVVIDEYAELNDQVSEDDDLQRKVRQVAQISRAHGIHLVIATQRPSANIIDTDLRSNLDMRVAFRVPKSEDSRVILDESGAEDLAGDGDMLFKEADTVTRLQGTLVESEDIREFIQEIDDGG